MLLAREEGNEKQPNVKMWGLGCGGGAVLKGMPLLKCRVIPRRALPFPARKGRGRGVGGRGPGSRPAGCGSEFQPRSGAGRGQALAFGPRSEHTSPARFPAWGNGTFLAGGASVPGERAFVSDSRRSETDGWLRAGPCGHARQRAVPPTPSQAGGRADTGADRCPQAGLVLAWAPLPGGRWAS